MIGGDTIGGIVGGKHCGWCTQKSDTWFERHVIEHLPARLVIAIGNIDTWMIGAWWHRIFHAKDERYLIKHYYTDDELRAEIEHEVSCGCGQYPFELNELLGEWDRRWKTSM